MLARERGIANVAFEAASIYQLPYADGSFDAAFASAVLQHLAAPLAALTAVRRVARKRAGWNANLRRKLTLCRFILIGVLLLKRSSAGGVG